MKKTLLVTLATVALGASTFVTFAQEEYPYQNQIEARQAVMNVYRFNLGMLGAMAKGEMPYDAGMASDAANNLKAAANMRNGAMWPAGSDMSAPGLANMTAAKPDIWSNMSDVGEKSQALKAAVEAMSAAAGNGLDALRSNMGALGDGCKGCHEPFRASD
ncbi:MAG: c-type cytochrome [Woeseiaceae bacterium]